MRVALVGPALEENLALGCLKASLDRAGHCCSIERFNTMSEVPRLARAIVRGGFGLVGFSLVAQRRYPEFQRLAAALRRGGFEGHLTAGGHFAGLRAAEVLRDTPELDTILHHDGEERLAALVGGLEAAGNLRAAPPAELDGVSWRAPDGGIAHRPAVRVCNLDDLPDPARLPARRTLGYPMAPVVTSRGCSGTCTFCSIHAWHRQVPSGRLRFRSPARVAAEMIRLHRERGVRVFIFHDDDFLHPDPRLALDRCRAILDPVEREIGPFAFVIKCRPDDVEEDLFAYLKARGLARAYVGIESHSQAGIRALNRRVLPETNERALSILRALGVYSCFNLLVFHPDSTADELEENLAFLGRHADIPFDVARAELYARSALEDRMVREGRALGDYRGYDYRIADQTAERAFRRFAARLWERHFGGASILHRSQELGYRVSLLRRFHPGMVTPDLERRTAALIRGVNLDTVEHLRGLLAQATEGSGIPGAIDGAFEEDVAERVRRHTRTWRLLSCEVEGRARLGRLAARVEELAGTGSGAIERLARLAPGSVLLLGASCGTNGTQVCDPPPPPVVSFATDVEPTLSSVCAVPGCHAGETPPAGLDLAAGRAYDDLVGVPSTQVPARKRVDPYRHEESYLMNKLEGTQAEVGGSGVRMPKQGTVPAGFVEKVRGWIQQGAQRN